MLSEMWRAIKGLKDTLHNCYGAPKMGDCGGLWEDSPNGRATTVPVNVPGR